MARSFFGKRSYSYISITITIQKFNPILDVTVRLLDTVLFRQEKDKWFYGALLLLCSYGLM